jgi:anti-sigma-K factor RskA
MSDATDDIHALAGLYALDALEPDELTRFEVHLDRCATCRDEVGGFRATGARLGQAVAEPAPPSLRDSVLAEVARTRQTPRRFGSASARHRARWTIAASLAAAAAALVLVLGLQVRDLRGERDDLAAVADVLAARDAETATLTGSSGMGGRVVRSPSTGRAVVVLDGLPVVADDRAYALWAIGDAGPVPAGLVRPGGDGQVVTVIDADALAGAKAFGVTEEPASGSAAPTGPILLQGQL